MKKNDLAQALKSRQVRDYSYAIMFFIVSSFFAFFVIKPVLSIAIQIRREGEDLEKINRTYEDNITKMLELQSQLEDLHDKKFLLTEAMPNKPGVSQVIQDLQRAAEQAQVPVSSIEVANITYKSDGGQKNDPFVEARLQAVGGFDNIDALMKEILNQRRIKTIQTLTLTSQRAGESAVVNITLELNAQYLAQEEE